MRLLNRPPDACGRRVRFASRLGLSKVPCYYRLSRTDDRGDRTIMDIPEHRHIDAERRHVEHLYRFTDRLWRAESPSDLYQAALEAITCTLACGRASILLLDETGRMRFASQRGMSDVYR